MNFLKNRNKAYTKNKSIVMLVIYGVFFIFVFIIIAIGNSNVNSSKTYEDYIKEDDQKEEQIDNIVTNYEYNYKITDNTNTVEVSGTKTKEKEIFTYNGKSYNKQNNNIYLNDGTNTLVTDNIFNTDLYSYEYMDNFFKEKNTKEKTTYEDGKVKEIYSINSKEYFDYIKEDKCTNVDCNNINIDVTINKNSKEQIEKIIINLTNYYKYNYIIELNYTNINNIKEVSTN